VRLTRYKPPALAEEALSQVLRKAQEAGVKMVKNEKGLWVKVKAAPGEGGSFGDDADDDDDGSYEKKRPAGRGRGGGGLSAQ
jgi:hypothetical protein